VVAHAFNPSTREAEAGGSLEFEASLVYRVSSRTAGAIQRNPVSKNQKKKKKKENNCIVELSLIGLYFTTDICYIHAKNSDRMLLCNTCFIWLYLNKDSSVHDL
jgi:hypothetical protein